MDSIVNIGRMPSMKYKKLQLEEIKIMDVLERNVMRECNTLLVDNLDAKDIAPFLYSKQFLNENQMEEIFNNKCIRRNICQMFLLMVVKTCPFKVFLFALRLYNQYSFLADKLEECVSKRRAFKQQHGRETEIVEVKCDKEETVQSITKQVDKISISSSHKRKIAIIAHKLKTLSHDGKTEKLKKHTQIILDNFKLKKVSGCFKRPVTKQMELADLAFTALEAEVIARRVKYDVTLYGSKVYDEMKSLIPFTTNPTTSSMTFLSR